MSTLHTKLLRELRRLWSQFMAIAMVMAAGVATLLIGVGTYQSLDQTRSAYYRGQRFADMFASVTRAPRTLLQEIARIEGVSDVDGRIAQLAIADIEGIEEPASVLLLSLPTGSTQGLNQLYLRSGRLPEIASSTEAAVSEVFAKANRLQLGSNIDVIMNGTLRGITVVGVALSPDYVYAVAPGESMPNEGRFGVLWVPAPVLAAAYGMKGAFNTVSLKLLPRTSEHRVSESLDIILAPFGGQGAYGRAKQTSHAYLSSELTQLRSMSSVLPPIFLFVAAFLVNMTLLRLITLEREQIGLLKALGYSAWSIARYYIELVVLIGLIGVAIGIFFGVWAGGALASLYARFYSFPELIFSRDPLLFLIAGGATLLAAVVGAVRGVSAAARLPPAVAMSPPAPPVYRNRGRRSSLPFQPRKTWVMVTRHIMHWPWRSAGGVIGLSFSVAVLVGSLWSVGGVNHVVDYTFNKADRQDATLVFSTPKTMSAIQDVGRLPAVLAREPFRAVGVEVRSGHIARRIALLGRGESAVLTKLFDAHMQPVRLPRSGILLTHALAKILGVGRGDSVDVRLLEGNRQIRQVYISGVVEGYLGLSAYMELGALEALVQDGGLISGAYLTLDPLERDRLYATLKRTPSAGSLSVQAEALKQFRATMAQNMYVMIGVLAGLASLIAFGVVYNFSRISLSEQGRELASLRVLGFTRREVSSLLLAETAALTLVAQPVGWGLGLLLAWAMVQGFSTEMFAMPLVVGPEVFASSSLIVIFAAIVSGLIVRRRVDRLDMIAVLKTRE